MDGVKWLFPTAPKRSVTGNYGAPSASWFDIPAIPVSPHSPNFQADVLEAVSSVHGMIDAEVMAGTPADKIFVCGFSQGAALALASAMLYPEKLAGAAIAAGWVPLDPNFDFHEKIPAKAKLTKVLWMHGTSDRIVPFAAGEAVRPLLEHAGVRLEFKSYPGIGHFPSDEELLHLETWFGIQLQNSSSS